MRKLQDYARQVAFRAPALAIGVLMLGACAETISRSPLRAQNQLEPGVFDRIAADVLHPLAPGQRIALQPFRATDSPLPLAQAQDFNDSLARAIEKAAGATHIIVAREDLPRLFAEAEEFGAAADTQKLLEASRADVLLIGEIVRTNAGVDLSYRALDIKSGRQLAATPPHFIAADTSAPLGLPLDQALATAADALIGQVPDMKAVETLAITYQQSDVQTPLGSYIGRTLNGKMVERIGGRAGLPAAMLAPVAEVEPPLNNDDRMVRPRPGVFMLSGTLWDLGSDVEVRLTLRGDTGSVASHGVRIRRDAIPRSLLPIAPTLQQADARAFELQISSDRGQRPVYAVGDSARLVVHAARGGYLYCFHKSSPQAGGGIVRIFPNPYHSDARIAGDTAVRIPGDDMDFALRVHGPAGTEVVRCFVLERDVAQALPPVLAGTGLTPVNVHSLDDLGRIFRTLPAGGIAEATLTMTIDPAS